MLGSSEPAVVLGELQQRAHLLDRRLRANTITSCAGTHRYRRSRRPQSPAVAWPDGAVISSLSAHAVLRFVRTSDVLGVDRGARIDEDAAVRMIDRDRVADCPNSCEGGNQAWPRFRRCWIHEERHSRARHVLLVLLDSAVGFVPFFRNRCVSSKPSAAVDGAVRLLKVGAVVRDCG
jgi:hypothetical protein